VASELEIFSIMPGCSRPLNSTRHKSPALKYVLVFLGSSVGWRNAVPDLNNILQVLIASFDSTCLATGMSSGALKCCSLSLSSILEGMHSGYACMVSNSRYSVTETSHVGYERNLLDSRVTVLLSNNQNKGANVPAIERDARALQTRTTCSSMQSEVDGAVLQF
jgi:hypothetical protein